ncbi:ADP compounds hydrolase NudE [Shewanella yunxiaonensis]|uniref:ADP compounds hydrolase NudE n=1 Tax=Shewanella yunxiaonensis TaxID=2829809 RepID=A0ABX7YTF1_9GAMM|nr:MULTISPECIES: ADP compounds hydrolase NudE [Shewanella]MDF0534565.1 ADP compounds hydrolase NudE [Shewanella sp. A32]QUN06054.1 ADP compounds hydrolase NudE [Shewanella yunxiaonensis]
MSKRQQKPEILHKETVAQSRLFHIEQVHLRFSNQQERFYERMKGGTRGAVMIVPVLQRQWLLLGREYAAGTEQYELGFPKGLIDPGETPEQAANRELQEEIGYGCRQLIHLKELSLAPGYFASKMQIFLAEDLYESRLEGDEPEPIEMVSWALPDWRSLLEQGDFSESRSVSALFLALDRLKLKV